VAAGSARDSCAPRAGKQPEPSRGARTLRTAPAGVWRPSPVETALGPGRRQQGAPDVVAFVGARTPGEAAHRTRERLGLACGIGPEKGCGRRLNGKSSGEGLNSKGGARGAYVLRARRRRGRPRGRFKRRGGGAGSQQGATRHAHILRRRGRPHESQVGRGQPRTTDAQRTPRASGGATREPRSASTRKGGGRPT